MRRVLHPCTRIIIHRMSIHIVLPRENSSLKFVVHDTFHWICSAGRISNTSYSNTSYATHASGFTRLPRCYFGQFFQEHHVKRPVQKECFHPPKHLQRAKLNLHWMRTWYSVNYNVLYIYLVTCKRIKRINFLAF